MEEERMNEGLKIKDEERMEGEGRMEGGWEHVSIFHPQ